MTNHDDPMLPLPGMEPTDATRAPATPLVAAVRRTIAALEARGLLHEWHAATCALALAMADAVEAGTRSRRASAAAMAAAQLREALLMLPDPLEGADPEGDSWDALVRQFVEAGENGTGP